MSTEALNLKSFLIFLGDRVDLNGFGNFCGGLDVKRNATGDQSVFTIFKGFEIMFHVSTLLPFTPGDEQQVERKRHLGNDIVQIVFKEGNQPFNPAVFRTHFTHIFVVIQAVPAESSKQTCHYKIAIANKAGVKPHRPHLPNPAVFQKNNKFRSFLLCKLINSERAALDSPEFKHKALRTRSDLLKEIINIYIHKTHKNVILQSINKGVENTGGALLKVAEVTSRPFVYIHEETTKKVLRKS